MQFSNELVLPLGDVTGFLNKNGSRSMGSAPPEGDVGMLNGRKGLSERHSSSKVTERLDNTILVEGR